MMPVRKTILQILLKAWLEDPMKPRRHQRNIDRMVGMDVAFHLQMLAKNGLVDADGRQHYEITSSGIRALARCAQAREFGV